MEHMRGYTMKVGDLVQTIGYDGTLWLLLEIVENSILVASVNTGYKMWAKKVAFEVIQ